MMEPILKIDFSELTEAIPAFITMIAMPFTYSIANGLIFGILSYVIMKLFTGKMRRFTQYLRCWHWSLSSIWFTKYNAVTSAYLTYAQLRLWQRAGSDRNYVARREPVQPPPFRLEPHPKKKKTPTGRLQISLVLY